jgi:nitroimidazol reductase NimA-like FMN-containing flavoprotein (pyridoxamine 5'-phosphate oxidase superfamily)
MAMKLTDARTDIEVLERDACRRLLEASEIGRLALCRGGSPEIFPVNFAVRGDRLVFHTRPGTKLDAATGSRAAFEIDGLDRLHRTGWSVIAKGRLEEVQPGDHAWPAASTVAVDTWADGERPHVLVMTIDHLTGRRVGWSD